MGIGLQEMIILGVIGVLLFGKRLPEVGRQLGKGLSEFKRGMQGIESEIHSAMDTGSYSADAAYDDLEDDYQAPTAPKFQPPSAAPQMEGER
ncbi:MAG: Sec-independent protein translocase TatA [Planctomycetales bacterium]|nr:Sec-independent protein translocase TatA [Planctomycetales bacterium]NIP68207.1 Sec-independent protein translocase TatA [Planctomycetales bacterium]